jgi:hypothetical protein
LAGLICVLYTVTRQPTQNPSRSFAGKEAQKAQELLFFAANSSPATKFRQVLDCASPLALLKTSTALKSGSGLPHSKTQALSVEFK